MSWINRKLRRQRPLSPLDTHSQTYSTKTKPPIKDQTHTLPEQLLKAPITPNHQVLKSQSQSLIHQQRRHEQSRNHTTVAAKGLNGSKKTIITIQRVYRKSPELTKKEAIELSSHKSKPSALLESPLKSFGESQCSISKASNPIKTSIQPSPLSLFGNTLHPKSEMLEQVSSDALCDSDSDAMFMDAAESFGIEIPTSPSTTLKGECPALKSPSFSGRSLDSMGSLATLMVDDGLDMWGLPEVVTQPREVIDGPAEESLDQETRLYLYGIGPDPELECCESDSLERNMKVSLIRYMSAIVIARKLRVFKQSKAYTKALISKTLETERSKQLRNQFLPIFASWM